MRFGSLRILAATLFAVVLVLASVSLAQNIVTGGISGTVTDPTGAIVPNAKVNLKSNTTGETQTTVTTSTGLFNFPLLKPGSYSVTISQTGFRSIDETVEVQLGQVITANLKLLVGNASETVEVSSQAPLLQTEDANISTTFNQAQIAQLPNPGGDITSYAQTAPGVLMNTGGTYGNFSAFGLPATSNLFTENGNDENDPFLNLNNSGSSNLLIGQNEVQEVAVVSNGYTAQYGRQAGVQVDYTTKSGSNAFHGNAGFWYNSSGFNANDWFQKQSEIANGTPNQQPFAVNHEWAGSIGGPIVKNKLFFFVDQEGLYYALPSIQHVFLPTPAFSAAVLSNIAAVSPAQVPFYTNWMGLYANSPVAGSAVPLNSNQDQNLGCGVPGTPASGGSYGVTTLAGSTFGAGGLPCLMEATGAGVNHNKEWLLTERIDYNISSADKLFGRFKADHGQQPTSTDLIDRAAFSTQSTQPEYEGQINETHIFSPNVINNAILSGLWYTAIFLPDSGQAAVLAATGGYSTVSVGGSELTNIGGGSGTGQTPDYFFPQGRNSTMGQLTDDLSITRGAHTFKVGINFRRDDLTDFDAQSNTGGLVTFGSMTSFVNGVVSSADGGNLTQNYTTNGDVRIGFYSLGLYFQDEVRVTPNLKLTLALRGDRNSNPICASNCFSRLNTPFTGLTHDVNTPYNAIIDAGTHSAFPAVEKIALQPRFGFTWSPLGHSSTVLRGGIGVFSDLYQGVLMDELISNAPLSNGFTVSPASTSPIVGAPVAPGVTGSVAQLGTNSNSSFVSGFKSGETLAQILAGNQFFSPPNYTSIANQINNPKYLEWNFEIQQAIGSKMSLNIDYVGTHGYDNLIQNANLNASYNSSNGGTPFGTLPASFQSCTLTNNCATNAGVPLSGTDARFGFVRELQSVGISNYDGLVTTFTRRFSHGFQGSVNWTYSHALDDLTSTNPGTPFNALYSVVYQINPNCLRCENYSNSDSDARHNLTANYVWELPFKSQNKLLNETAGGWSVAGTFYAHSSLPWTPEVIQSNVLFQPNNPSIGVPLVPADTIGSVSTNCAVSGPGTIANPNSCVQQSQFQEANPSDFGPRRNSFRGLGYFDTDLNVNKRFAVTERAQFEVGASFFNILNHPNFALPFPLSGVGGFGQMTSLAVQPTTPYGSFQGAGVEGRLVQIHGKIVF
ncbi:MAG: carboxypeptidase-like regulatory domain-containing protein [Candidatus Sulfotelmatobacter sp.]